MPTRLGINDRATTSRGQSLQGAALLSSDAQGYERGLSSGVRTAGAGRRAALSPTTPTTEGRRIDEILRLSLLRYSTRSYKHRDELVQGFSRLALVRWRCTDD